jgi:hypothetical protein
VTTRLGRTASGPAAALIRWLLAALFCLATPALSATAELSRADADAIRAAIRAQLQAFARDDAAAAFSLATRGIRAQFRTAEAIMAMVRSDYPVVYRPRSVTFESAVTIEGAIMQPVRMTDAYGAAWIALYPMERQADGRWLINGCQLAQLSGRHVGRKTVLRA